MKVWIARDWTGSHVFAEEPYLLENLSGFPPTWSGCKLPFVLAEDMKIPRNKALERNIWWSIVNIIK